MEIVNFYKTYFLTTASVSNVTIDLDSKEVLFCESAKPKSQNLSLENQKDLMKIISVLVSTGINLNDDVFLPEEILPVRHTGAHKPLNLEHDSKQIVGHMIRTYAALKDGTIIADKDVPENNDFDIISESVLYKYMFPDLAEDIKKLAKMGKLFVSIEAWFTAYDFLVGSKIVKRNQETASLLDAKLKINGGQGIYENKKLGRVLRNIIIGGQGLVRVPANPTSIIKSVSSLSSEIVHYDDMDDLIKNNVIGDIFQLSTNNLKFSEERNMDNKDVVEEIAQVIAAQKAAAQVIVTENKQDVKQLDTKEKVDNIPVINDIYPEIKALQEKVALLEARNLAFMAEREAEKQKTEANERSTILKELGLSEKFIIDNLGGFFEDRNDFDKFVSILNSAKSEFIANISKSDTITETKTDTIVKKEEVAKTSPETKVEVETKVQTEVSNDLQNKEIEQETSQDEEDEDVISLEDLDLVDKEIKVETDNSSAPTLVEKMADVVQMFLKDKNAKWGKLALKK